MGTQRSTDTSGGGGEEGVTAGYVPTGFFFRLFGSGKVMLIGICGQHKIPLKFSL